MKNFKYRLLTALAVSLVAGGTAISVVSAESPSQIQAASVSVAQAKKVALEAAPAGKVVSVDFEAKKDGRLYYEVTILEGNSEKEYKIDARTASILNQKVEAIDDYEDSQLVQANLKLSFEDAENILLQKYPQAKIYDEELDIKAGQIVYQVKALNGQQKIKMTLDANSGAVLQEKAK
ncbi:PepSY domain-containing protein [Streptococcus oricebi]|nr:PepSY domain-containing protein [Streptococcus oricebi]